MTDLRLYRKGSFLAALLLLAIVLVVKWMAFSAWNRGEDGPSEELLRFDARMDSVKAAESMAHTVVEKSVVLHSFDPNIADSVELSELGLRGFVVRNILKYREKGGRFRKPSDLSRIYGMEEDVYASLEPYITISHNETQRARTAEEISVSEVYVSKVHVGEAHVQEVHMQEVHALEQGNATADVAARKNNAEGHGPNAEDYTLAVGEKMKRLELNNADSLSLVAVRGIGPYTARRIMAYRKALGGFVAVEQLDEIEGLRAENLVILKTMAYVDSSLVVPISLNTSSLKHLQHHPYLSFSQAKAIVELRTHRHQPVTLNDLTMLEEFTPADIHRLKPYLCE